MDDLVKYYKNSSQYLLRILDGQGNPIIGQNVTFNINGVFYNRLSDSNGVAKLNINLNHGEYVITATNPNDGLMHSNSIFYLYFFSVLSQVFRY